MCKDVTLHCLGICSDLNTKEYWMNLVVDQNLPRLGAGISRTVYALNSEQALKIEEDESGWRDSQCAKEVTRWRESKPARRELLATIFESGDRWLIMERASTTLQRYRGDDDPHAIIANLRKKIAVGDLHAGNVGVFKGSFKIIDYGM